MSIINAARRKSLPKSDFGLPGEDKYPMPDKSHAGNAKARVSQMVKAGKATPAQKAEVDAKADKILGKGKKAKPKARKMK